MAIILFPPGLRSIPAGGGKNNGNPLACGAVIYDGDMIIWSFPEGPTNTHNCCAIAQTYEEASRRQIKQASKQPALSLNLTLNSERPGSSRSRREEENRRRNDDRAKKENARGRRKRSRVRVFDYVREAHRFVIQSRQDDRAKEGEERQGRGNNGHLAGLKGEQKFQLTTCNYFNFLRQKRDSKVFRRGNNTDHV